jgi:molybdopterin-guanine dinucleotide biosynthesis protein A
MTTEVIILAQGTQKRLGMAHGYKQLLKLPACGGVPIMERTVRQVDALRGGHMIIVCTRALEMAMPRRLLSLIPRVELPDPGNSSLKGIARYLEQRGDPTPRTIVLFGDVVYSWACLEQLLKFSESYGFVGTANLSAGGGELWGVAWSREFEDEMVRTLRDALLRHPPFNDEYQPGQMRRWITGWRRGDIVDHIRDLTWRGHYAAVDDYTHDIDLPPDIALLPELSIAAAKDDADHGALWP